MKKVTVVIPTRKSPNTLSKVLDSLVKQDYPNFEVFVIDDCPELPSESVVKKYKNVKYFKNPKNLGLSKSLNRGIRESDAEIVITLHDDCVPQSEKWVSKLVGSFTNEKIAIVTSQVVFNFDKLSSPNKIFSYIYGLGKDVKMAKNESGLVEISHIGDKCDAYRKDVLEKVGLFNENFLNANEDTYLSNEVLKRGYKILENRDLKVEHIFSETERQNSIRTHLKKALQYTRQSIILFLKFRTGYNFDNVLALLTILFSFLYFINPLVDVIAVLTIAVLGLMYHKKFGVYSLLLLALSYYLSTVWLDIPLKGAIIGLSYFIVKGKMQGFRYIKEQKSIVLFLPIVFFSMIWNMLAGYGWIKGAVSYFLKR